MLKAYCFRSQSFLSDNSILSSPVTDMKNPFRSSNLAPNSVSFGSLLPLSHQTQKTRQTIICVRKNKRGGWPQRSTKLVLQLASMIALNLKILPQPLESLIGEFAPRDGNGVYLEYLNGLGGRAFDGWSRKRKKGRNFLPVVVILICGLGVISWRISELDLFLRVLSFCLLGISLIRLLEKKRIKDWILGFLLGIVLMSFRLGKEDVKFWVERLRTCSPAAQIVLGNRNRSRRKRGNEFKLCK
ncbi:hypothetical protein L6164_035057 [Bauhinia variegata]|uniref:Uncharacterized protein n=1 Tax=Bauhinia variegata TaxID=167791 RepID=A0ACB9KY79_BAUVA|nr:hypothetical protein L6164_035057 [Bauhinia variegata]